MNESEQEKKLNMLISRTEHIEGKLDGLKLELRTAAIFLAILIMSLQLWSLVKSLLAAFAISGIFTLRNWLLYRKYGSF